MAAYIFFDVTVLDQARFDQYLEKALPVLEKYGGKVIAFEADPTVLEGDWAPKRAGAIEFKDADTAKEFYHSSDYQECVKLREGASVDKLVLVQGT